MDVYLQQKHKTVIFGKGLPKFEEGRSANTDEIIVLSIAQAREHCSVFTCEVALYKRYSLVKTKRTVHMKDFQSGFWLSLSPHMKKSDRDGGWRARCRFPSRMQTLPRKPDPMVMGTKCSNGAIGEAEYPGDKPSHRFHANSFTFLSKFE